MAEGFERLVQAVGEEEEEEDSEEEAEDTRSGAPARPSCSPQRQQQRLRLALGAPVVGGLALASFLALAGRNRRRSHVGVPLAGHPPWQEDALIGLDAAAAFTCEVYGCLDVRSQPANPCGCSQHCVKDGNCCTDYQAVCAPVTPANNVRLGSWAGCSATPTSPAMTSLWHYQASGPTLPIRVMSYNAEWWHVVEQMGGNGNSAAKTIVDASAAQRVDLVGMQEFYDPWYGFTRPGFDGSTLLTDFQWLRAEVGGPVGSLIAYRKSEWSLVSRGQRFVAEDKQGDMYFGKRIIFWARLYHLTTGKMVFMANHHGPLPVNTGGICGGTATASNILNAIAESAQDGDAIVFVGDFNADQSSLTHTELSKYLRKNFGGIDNIWTNLPPEAVSAPMQVGGGGSDHNGITAVLQLGGPAPAR